MFGVRSWGLKKPLASVAFRSSGFGARKFRAVNLECFSRTTTCLRNPKKAKTFFLIKVNIGIIMFFLLEFLSK